MKKSEIRSSRLMELLQVNRRLDVNTVADTLGVSVATVRRLLARLERDGKVIRTHGGAHLSPPPGTGYSYYMSSTHRSAEKALIARAVMEMVDSGDHIFLDSGTTVLKLTESLSQRLQAGSLKNIVVITNSLAVVETLSRWCKVILLGGEIREARRDVCGPITEDTLRQFHVSKAFLGADAVHLHGGFMATDESTAKMNEIILGNAAHAFVLADSEKFSRDSFIRYAGLGDVEATITDDGIPPEALAAFQKAGARIQVAPSAPRHAARSAD